jgi:F-type H+-transporting ATPase subunit epsilon
VTLTILLPSEVFAKVKGVTSIVAETDAGSFGLLPGRLDCVAALVPGILTYRGETNAEVYVAVDAGVLVKAGPDVTLSVRHAIGGIDLSKLHAAVEREFLSLDAQEKDVRTALAKMETGLLRRLTEFTRKS